MNQYSTDEIGQKLFHFHPQRWLAQLFNHCYNEDVVRIVYIPY